MEDRDFELLVESIKEGGAILRQRISSPIYPTVSVQERLERLQPDGKGPDGHSDLYENDQKTSSVEIGDDS